MTVQELIAQLQECAPDAEVFVKDSEYGLDEPILEVKDDGRVVIL